MPDLDFLVYHDLDDPIHETPPVVGADASEWFGDLGNGQYVVAVGPPIHEGKDATVVIAHSHQPMEKVQALLDRLRPNQAVPGGPTSPSKWH